jgi:hypothetical protein
LRPAIQSVEWDGATYRVKFLNRLPALECLARYEGMFERDNRQRGADAIATLLAEIGKVGAGLPIRR